MSEPKYPVRQCQYCGRPATACVCPPHDVARCPSCGVAPGQGRHGGNHADDCPVLAPDWWKEKP